MKIGWSFLLILALCGCATDIHFRPHVSASRALPVPVVLGVYYTTGTLERVEEYKNKNIHLFKKWRVHVGDALKQEVLSRVGPMVKTLALVDSPYPESDLDLVLTLGIEKFGWGDTSAEIVLSAALRNRDGAILLEKQYMGSGTGKLTEIAAKTTKPEQGLGETTREAITVALNALIEDIKPYLARSAP